MVKPAGIDVHAHFFPESFIRVIEEAGAQGLERPLAIIQAKATGLSRKDQECVVRSNAARMLHLE